MILDRMGVVSVLAVGLAILPGCAGDDQVAQGEIIKGGDDRNGEYTATANWWKPAPDHDEEWGWGQVSGVAADSPDRIIVAVWGDRNATGEERPNSSNYMVVVDGNGDIIERWTQWDTMLNTPHQVYISPYDPERHVWVVERGGGVNDIHEQVIKFTNDGKEIALRLLDPNPRQSGEEARANTSPGPLDFGQASVMAFLPNGDFLIGDGYQNGRIARYNAEGELVSEFGSVGDGPGQFDLIHGIAVDRDRRIYVADRENDRIQVFTENGEFIEEWPDVTNPAGIFIDENESIWVVSATLNRLIQYDKSGQLQSYFGAYGGTRGGFPGGLDRPHQVDVDQEGNVYVASWDGGWLTKYTPRPGADASKLAGTGLVLE
jgi:sugar lactone lactonase YvrE